MAAQHLPFRPLAAHGPRLRGAQPRGGASLCTEAAIKAGVALDRVRGAACQVRIGEALSHKRSTGYCAPELLRLGSGVGGEGGSGSGRRQLLPGAQPAFDVWSFGVVLYLLCTGQSLLHIDALEDNLQVS